MKQQNVFLSFRKILYLFFWVTVFSTWGYSQTGTSIYWSQQVGCIEYDSEGNPEDPKRMTLLEDLQDGTCVRVCENTTVSYYIDGTNITNVSWTATGGTLNSTSGSTNEVASIAWGNSGYGSIAISISYSDGSTQNITICIEKIVSPIAQFDIYGINPDPVFCVESDVYFDNLSVSNGGTNIFSYFWDFGDGTYSTAFEPVHSYNQPGNYTVKLVVYNLCSCYSSFGMEVKIEPQPEVEIYCPSIACEGDVATYTTSANCPGAWEVEGGHIVANNGVSIDVKWDNAWPSGFGTVNYKSECACPFWTSIRVPVVLREGVIEGPTEICVGDQGIYNLPQWPTTDFTWSLIPISNPGSTTNLVFNTQRNQIVVDALESGTYVLHCDYKNTLVGCVGQANFSFSIGEGTTIEGDEQICAGTQHTYTNTDNAYVTWVLKLNNSTVTTYNGTSFPYTFTNTGVYTLSVVNASNPCDSEPFTINVHAIPPAPTGTLNGEIYICPGQPYEYTLANNNSNTYYEWDVTNGSIVGSTTGTTVTVIFDPSGPYSLNVSQIYTEAPGCESAVTPFAIYELQPDVTVVNNENKTIFCPSSETTYTATFNNFTPDYIEWIVPNNFGNVIQGINDPTVTVSWNEISNNNNTGVIRLLVRVCGVDHYYDTDVELYELPELSLDVPTAICYGSPIVANLSVTSPQPVTTGTILWDFGNGTTTTTPINPSGTYSLSNPYNNTMGSNVTFTITATLQSPNGCLHEPYSQDVILVYPRTTISITPGYNIGLCPATYNGTEVLYANAVSGLNVTLSYQWFRNNVAIPGAVSSSYQIPTGSPLGTYYVEVLDSNNCTAQSQNIQVFEYCGPSEPCSIPANANINLTAAWTDCNTITASLSYNGTASVNWVHSSFLTQTSANNYGATFSTDTPGNHTIFAQITFQTPQGPCTATREVDVIKHYDPEFNYSIECNSTSTGYNVTLYNNSLVFDIGSNNPVTYTFSGTSMSPQTGQIITVPNLAPGSHDFTLQLTSSNGPACTITKTIVLDALPNSTIGAIAPSYCAESPITLTVNNYNPNNTYEWFFAGTSFIASGPVTNIQVADPYVGLQIELVESSPFTCTRSTAVYTDITKADYSSASLIAANSPACQGVNPGASITFNSGFSTLPSMYDWMMGDQVIANTTTNVFYPSSTGTYWVMAYDANGCRYALASQASVIIIPQPQAYVTGPSEICNEGEAEMHGSGPSNGAEYRWLINGSPAAGVYGTWSTSTPRDIPVDTATQGTFTFTFEVRLVNSTACVGSNSKTVTVYPPVIEPVLSYNVITCEPYVVEVTASGGSGNYNWSNGTHGTVTQTTTGGAIGVFFTDANGCSAEVSIMVPHPLEASLWMIPSGCYSICLTANPGAFILAPLMTVDYFEWNINSQTVLSGAGPISNIAVTQAGTYQLVVENDGCIKESSTFSVSPSLEDCEYVDCKLKIDIKEVKFMEGSYWLYGAITNPNPFPMTLNLSSFNGYGVYNPSTITIPASSAYYFGPLQFIPNSTFTGGDDIMVVQSDDCLQVAEVRFPSSMSMRIAQPAEASAMTVTPNPADSYTVVDYTLGDGFKKADKLTVYSLLGVPLREIKLTQLSGSIKISTDILPAGSYIITLEADGQRAQQKVLVIK